MASDLERLTGPDRRSLGLATIPWVLAIFVAIGMFILWPGQSAARDLAEFGVASEAHRAVVTKVVDAPCSYSPEFSCRQVTFTLSEGPTPGSIVPQEFEILATTPEFTVGESVMLNYLPDSPATLQYQFADRDRRGLLVAVALAFALAVVLLGRMRGLAALGGLAASVVVLIWFIVPAILAGSNPVAVAAVGSAAIGFLALYMAHGYTTMTHVALIGTFSALAVTVAASAATVGLARFSGFAGEESFYLTLVGDLDVRGLLLAGIVLGTLGALDDVTVTQASAVWELRAANPGMGVKSLFSAGLRVGRDHIASTVNTLLLAYAGASMPLLLLFALSGQRLGVVANSEVVATEIVRTLVGSIGLVVAVPITTWLAAVFAGGSRAR